MLYKRNLSTLKTIGYSWIYSWYIVMSIVYGPSGRFTHVMDILHCLGQVLYLGRALCTKETLLDLLKWRWVTRHPLVFRGLTGSQRILGFGASQLGIRAYVYDYLGLEGIWAKAIVFEV